MFVSSVKPLFSILLVAISLIVVVILLSPSTPFSGNLFAPNSSLSTRGKLDIWSVQRIFEWRPCKWWLEGALTALPAESNGYIRVDCYGGLNQMRRDFCDGVGIARLLNATLVLPKFEVAAYWNESSCMGLFVDHFEGENNLAKFKESNFSKQSQKEPDQVTRNLNVEGRTKVVSDGDEVERDAGLSHPILKSDEDLILIPNEPSILVANGHDEVDVFITSRPSHFPYYLDEIEDLEKELSCALLQMNRAELFLSGGFADVFDVDYFIQQMNGFVKVVKEMPAEIASKEPFHVDCSKRKGHFDYIESVLPSLMEHHYISITPAMSQRRDRYPLYAKASLCQACYNALRLTRALEKKGSELLEAIPKPFLSLHLRFEPDMVAYSQCQYPGLSPASIEAIEAAQGDRKPWTGDTARIWRNRGKCPLTPYETAFILQALSIPKNTTIYLAAGDGLLEIEGLTSIYTNIHTKAKLLSGEDFTSMHGNTKAALDYFVSINSDSYVATYFGNMDKMVAAMRAFKGMFKTLLLSRRAFAEFTAQGLKGRELMEALWKAHRDDFVMGRGSALPDCFCEFKL
ncbi:hypothetical protein HHK36_013964 [Tetracentron sinense]|uniref:O-fucosyltransferase family protein n=1 Tax=Tetracentron sinense TaxID=13715 RepID=A0A834Z489_TETSI|nr:hypothetical protein HHK36_013964 [Tetracentron sinense]